MAERKAKEAFFHGVPVCTGIAIGRPFRYCLDEHRAAEYQVTENEVESEITRYRQAVKKTEQEVTKLQELLIKEGSEEGAQILETYQQLLKDASFTDKVEMRISETLCNVESVFQAVICDYEKRFSSIPDPFFQERFKDVLDLSRRVMKNLTGGSKLSLKRVPKGAIIFASELGITDIAEVKSSDIQAFVTEVGGETSHAAIMARSRGIPFVANIDMELCSPEENQQVVVDGRKGLVVLTPSKKTLTKYQKLKKEVEAEEHFWSGQEGLKTETLDGYQMRLSANLESLHEIEFVHKYGGDGVGLFRSENLCLKNQSLPTEKEQFLAYKELITKLKGLPLVIRTFDVGGDKLEHVQLHRENNPFLGCRAIRYMLKERDAFCAQIRAILRASQFGPVGIMFPMISGLPELLEAKELVYEVREQLEQEGCSFPHRIPIGCMIEVPSAAICCDMLAEHSDFLSIGTNDLIQYSLAVDRGNEAMSYLYSSAHPSILRLIKMVVTEANRNGIPVSICGEMAANPKFTPLLLGLGVYELSVAPRYLPVIRHNIRNIRIVDAERFAQEVFTLSTSEEVEEYLDAEYQKNSSSLAIAKGSA